MRGGCGERRGITVGVAEGAWDGDARQFEAGERLRGDYETAALGPRVTMRWSPRVDGGAGEGLDPTTAQIAAKRRFDAALDAAGKGLSDIAWRTICAGERCRWRKRRWAGRCDRGGWC